MNILVDLFENQEQVLKQFADFLQAQNLVLCKQVAPDFPETPDSGPLAELKASLTAWTEHRHVRYDYKDIEFKRSIQGLIEHYLAQSNKIWANLPSTVRNSIEALALEVDGKLFICKFWRIWEYENQWIHYYMDDYESYTGDNAEFVGWEIQQFPALKL